MGRKVADTAGIGSSMHPPPSHPQKKIAKKKVLSRVWNFALAVYTAGVEEVAVSTSPQVAVTCVIWNLKTRDNAGCRVSHACLACSLKTESLSMVWQLINRYY